ncbi:5-methyltetrahydrofolate--homocysteine methyltransferase [Thalassotalea sp. 1_MG-2023]|uniref:5-methyltetrahydrofolate--homocysteine methyltransferase n=1 Tax=Thalassotalea sp. 1_MG-2023 TaxID=3062680 RepID=UPI0026E32744|nr:5-methyltetrahydrofolate--homocysteine methyltransferase [Thalassotalea sp. 1_MG-2023]MDO6427703.1 5-methyltetrahydrofolate--homocysteine methyltransferase [Thalassotalea sp. 1_MG-2023]
MTNLFKLNVLAGLIGSLILTGCGDAETTIVEQDPIVVDDGHDHGDDHDHDDGYTIESLGRLAVLSAETAEAAIFDLDDNELLDTFSLTYDSNSLTTSPGFRYAAIVNRSDDNISFIDSGLWREDHGEHLHDYEQSPALSDYTLMGSRPTHVINHDGQMAVFYDGDANTGTSASVQVLTDSDISSETSELAGIEYSVNMHGVAKPRGEHLLSTLRRDDADSTSNAKVLPDQVGVYHFHDGEYELEQTLDITCPDLHGAAQNHEFVAFGCGDGVLIAHQHNDEYEAEKVANISELNGLRIGTIYGHEGSESFIGIASGHGGGQAILVTLNPEENEMETIDWQPMADASPVSYAFAFGGEHFLILDNQGYLTVLSQHSHDGHMEWEFEGRIDISEEDVSTMPDNMSFTLTVAQNDHFAYVGDPIAKHILQVHIEDMEIEGDIELNFAPANISWLGIVEEGEEHDHDH